MIFVVNPKSMDYAAMPFKQKIGMLQSPIAAVRSHLLEESLDGDANLA